ncbi:hypothetical protein ACJIZ3_024788 [Penstemon smallii]|uniref:Uncharacterized protein n=1 Tax=Penstemon smallii TaxID=265156 RepID=A0ABD3TSV9_9LAMI
MEGRFITASATQHRMERKTVKNKHRLCIADLLLHYPECRASEHKIILENCIYCIEWMQNTKL